MVTEIIIGKQRNGSVGTIKLAWLPNYTKFGETQELLFYTEDEL